MFPIKRRARVHKVRNGTGNLLARGARVGPGRCGESGLHEQVSKREILLRAPSRPEQRIRRVLIGRIAVDVIRTRFEPFEDRPAEVQTGAGDDAQLFPGIVTNISKIKDSRISVGGVVASRAGTQRDPEGLPYTQRPNAGARRTRICRVIKRIARHAIAGQWIDPQDFPRKGIDHLGAKSADILRWPDDTLVERLLIVGHGIASVIAHVSAFTACGKQRPVSSKDERIGSVGVEDNGDSGALALADQNRATGGVYTMEIVRSPRRVACEPSNCCLVVFIDGRIIIRRSVMCQVVMVNCVKQINITILQKIRVKRDAQQPEIVPATYFVADVNQRGAQLHIVLKNPNPSGAFPCVKPTRRVESQTGNAIPIAADVYIRKTRRKRDAVGIVGPKKGQQSQAEQDQQFTPHREPGLICPGDIPKTVGHCREFSRLTGPKARTMVWGRYRSVAPWNYREKLWRLQQAKAKACIASNLEG